MPEKSWVFDVIGSVFLTASLKIISKLYFLIYSSQDIFISVFSFEGIYYKRLSPSFVIHLTKPL
jgi:hypothetical protein